MSVGGIAPTALNPALLSQWSSQLFTSLDTQQKGYIDRNDLQTALASSVVPTSKAAPGEQLFQALDRNGDGKVTHSELTATVQSLADKLFGNLRQVDGPNRSPPPFDLLISPNSRPARDANAAAKDLSGTTSGQLGNPGRMMAMLKLIDLVSAYGPNGQGPVQELPRGSSVDVSA